MNDIKPFVAVWMVTFNHELYIRQAIESVFMQETNFEFHLFIGEDCSTDDTSNICKYYAEKYPDKITLYAQKENIGAINNAQIIYKACFESGAKYVAMIEGDDYWTDPYKLQKQVDFLEKNEDFNGCFSSVSYSDLENNIIGQSPDFQINKFTFEYVVQHYAIHTASLLFRNTLTPHFLSKLKTYPYGDLPISLFMLITGDFYYFNSPMACYRKNVGIMHKWSTTEAIEMKIQILRSFLVDYKLRTSQSHSTKWSLALLYLKLSKKYAEEAKKIEALRCYLNFIRKGIFYFVARERVSITLKDAIHPIYIIITR